jgi:hypothetical protein
MYPSVWPSFNPNSLSGNGSNDEKKEKQCGFSPSLLQHFISIQEQTDVADRGNHQGACQCMDGEGAMTQVHVRY